MTSENRKAATAWAYQTEKEANSCASETELFRRNLCDCGRQNELMRLMKESDIATIKVVPTGRARDLEGMKRQALDLVRMSGYDEKADCHMGHGVYTEAEDGEEERIKEKEVVKLVKGWNDDTHPSHGQDKTLHFVISLPSEVDAETANFAAYHIGMDLFDSEERFGDKWSFYFAHHNVRAHCHTHIVVNRMGRKGIWLGISCVGPLEYDDLHNVIADKLGDYGIEMYARPLFTRKVAGDTANKKQGEAAEASAEKIYNGLRNAIELGVCAEEMELQAEDAIRLNAEISRLLRECAVAIRNGSDLSEIYAEAVRLEVCDEEMKDLQKRICKEREEIVKKMVELDEEFEELLADWGLHNVEYSSSKCFHEDLTEFERMHARILVQLKGFISDSELFDDSLAEDKQSRYQSVSYDNCYGIVGVQKVVERAVGKVLDQGEFYGVARSISKIRYMAGARFRIYDSMSSGGRGVHRRLAERWMKDEIRSVMQDIRNDRNDMRKRARAFVPGATVGQQARGIVKWVHANARDVFEEAQREVWRLKVANGQVDGKRWG